MTSRFVALCALALSIGAGPAAFAQAAAPTPTPTPIDIPTLPPNTKVDPLVQTAIGALNALLRRERERQANQASGEVTYFRRFDMQVRTGANAYRAIHLHQGTVINPRGTTITNGQNVTVVGTAQSDGSLNADTITVNQ